MEYMIELEIAGGVLELSVDEAKEVIVVLMEQLKEIQQKMEENNGKIS